MVKANSTCSDRIAAMVKTIGSYNIRARDFADKTGIAHSTWCRWKSGSVIPRADTLDRAEAALDAMVKAIKAGRP